MERGGGKAGRPMGTWTIQMLEKHVRDHESEPQELLLVLQELGYRTTRRAMTLKELVRRLHGENAVPPASEIGPLFTGKP